VDTTKLRLIRAAALGGHLPDGLSAADVRAYSEEVVADYDALASLQTPAAARHCLRYQLLALRGANETALVDRARALVRQAEDEGLLSVDEVRVVRPKKGRGPA
jgi:hypothetical protein